MTCSKTNLIPDHLTLDINFFYPLFQIISSDECGWNQENVRTRKEDEEIRCKLVVIICSSYYVT